MKLIARWTKHQDSSTEQPFSVTWEDGTPASLDDYGQHMCDTHTAHHHKSGAMEEHFYSRILATVVYDSLAKDWVVKVPGMQTFSLELGDPNIKDDEIVAAMYTYPTVYRAIIVRSPATVASDGLSIT